MKIEAESWPETQSVFEFCKRTTLTAESEDDAKVLGLLTKILRNGVPDGFEALLTDFKQKIST